MRRVVDVAIFVTQLESGGAQLAAFKLRKGLANRSYKVDLLFLYKKEMVAGDQEFKCLLDRKPRNLFDYLWIIILLIKYLLKTRPRNLISFTYYANVLCQLFGWIVGIKNRIASQRNPYDAIPNRIKKIDHLFGSYGIYSYNVMVSQSVLNSFSNSRGKYLARSIVIENGVEKPFHKNDSVLDEIYSSNSDFRLLHIGRFSKEKNHRLILEAVRELSNVQLHLIGSGELMDSYKEKFSPYEHIHFHGSISHNEVKKHLLDADLFLLPSLYEGMSNALIEALVYGLPVLVSQIPANEEVMGEVGDKVLLPLDDPDAWKEKIYLLSSDVDYYRKIKSECNKEGEKFNLDIMIDKFEELLKNGKS